MGPSRSGARKPEAEAGLQADAVVVGRVDAGVGDPDVAAGIDVDAIAVGVDLEVVDGQVVDAQEPNPGVSAAEDGEVAQGYVAAQFQGDGLVGVGAASPGLPDERIGAADQAVSHDGDVFETFTADQAAQRRIVGGGIGRCDDDGAVVELQGDIAAQADGAREVGSGGEGHGATACREGRVDGLVYGVPIERLAIGLGTERLDIETCGMRCVWRTQCKRHGGAANEKIIRHFVLYDVVSTSRGQSLICRRII